MRLHEAMFEHVQARVALFLCERLGVAAGAGQPAAQQLLAQLLYPRFTRALFGAVEPAAMVSDELGASPAVDLSSIQHAVAALAPRLASSA